MIDFDAIAAEAVDEQFGFRGRGRPIARAVARVRHHRAAVRDNIRAGWGSPGWQASQVYAEPYPVAYPIEEEVPEDELEESEEGEEGEEYGLDDLDEDFGDDGEGEEFAFDSYGRRGGGARPARRAVRRAVRKTKKRRQARRQTISSAQRSPMGSGSSYEEPQIYEEEPEEEYVESEFEAAMIPMFGEDQGPMLPSPVQRQQPDVFTTALKTGLGLGLGFMGVAIGVSVLAKAMR